MMIMQIHEQKEKNGFIKTINNKKYYFLLLIVGIIHWWETVTNIFWLFSETINLKKTCVFDFIRT